jgi:hypothetical protein
VVILNAKYLFLLTICHKLDKVWSQKYFLAIKSLKNLRKFRLYFYIFAFTGSYTVVKECIAESAHFATFPRKSTQLEEECDVLELNGFEVAYCLCRDGDLCNGPPIVEQFTNFEKVK